jgi:hypothetical protein
MIKLIPIWGQVLIVSAIVGGLFGAGWTVNGWRLGKANVKLKAELKIERVNADAWSEALVLCQSNRASFEEKLDAVVADVNEMASKGVRMQGAIDAASIRTREIAEAREALDRLEREHEDLVARAVPLDTCQTFELVLAAIAGGSHEQ